MSSRRAARSNTDHCRTGRSGTNTTFCSYSACLRLSYNVNDPLVPSSTVAPKLTGLHHSWSGNGSGSICSHCQKLRSEHPESQLPNNLELHLRRCHASAYDTVCQYIRQTTCLPGTNFDLLPSCPKLQSLIKTPHPAVHVDRDRLQYWFRLCYYLSSANPRPLRLWHWCQRCSVYWRSYGTFHTLLMDKRDSLAD